MIKELLSAIMMSDEGGGSNLPAVTEEDNGKILSVVNGEWNKKEPETDVDAVKYTAQELTTAQQMQARANQGLYYSTGEPAETIVWDGSADGRASFTLPGNAVYYKVADRLINPQEISEITGTVQSASTVLDFTANITGMLGMAMISFNQAAPFFGYSLFAGTYGDTDMSFTVPEDGTYIHALTSVTEFELTLNIPSTETVHKIEEKYLPDNIVSSVNSKTGAVVLTADDVAETVTETTDSTITLAWHDTVVVTNTPTALTVTLPTPVSGKDCICGLCFKAGTGFALTDFAPTGYSLHWEDEPTWTAGNVYEILYRYLGVDGIISAKYSEVSAT